MLRLVVIFISVFFFSLHFAATLYINSSFLEHFFPLQSIGFWYILGALSSIYLFFKAPKLLRWLGLRRFLFVFLFLTFLATIGAAYATTPVDAALFFILYAAAAPMVYFGLDLGLEEISSNKKTGELRGVYLTLLNIAIATGPLFITIMEPENKFKAFYIAAAVILVPLWVFIYFFLWPKSRHTDYENHRLPFRLWWRRSSVRRVTFARFVLELFFAFMVIYVPIYLHSTIGFGWAEIGVVFSIMLLPFILFEWPAGLLADRRYGEKEIMTLGFAITFLSLIFMPYLGSSLLLWTVALFISRVGAAFIEITTETYFFKKINVDDTGLLSIFRLARPVGLIVGAILGSLILSSLAFSSIFIVLAMIVLLGFLQSLYLKDTL